MNYFIYVFLDKKNRPYYVGKTSDIKRRRLEHLEEIKNGNTLPKYVKTRQIIKSGGHFHMRSIERVFDEREAYRIERKYIKKYRKNNYKLTNLTYGGPKELPMKMNNPAKENQKGLVFKKYKRKKKTKKVIMKTKIKNIIKYLRIWTYENRCLLYRKIREKFGAYDEWPPGSNTCPAGLGKEFNAYLEELASMFSKIMGKEITQGAVRQQFSWAITRQEQIDGKSQTSAYMLNIVAAYETGFLTNKNFPETLKIKKEIKK